MLWLGRLFEDRNTFARLTIVGLTGVGYLAMRPDGASLNTVDWFLSVGALVFGFAGIVAPFEVVVGLSAALGAGWFFGADNDVVPTVALAWGLFELGMRRSGPKVWIGMGLGVAGCMLSDLDEAWAEPITVFYAAAILAAPLLLGVQLRTTRELARQAADRAVQEVSRVRAEERTTIARELHDLVAHHVASIVLRVAVARNVLPVTDDRLRGVLDDVHATGSSALADLRRLVAVLRDPGAAAEESFVDPGGLPTALAAVVERNRGLGLRVESFVDPAITGLDARTALAVLRLTQEGLANVARHAGTAASARLSIRLEGEQVEFELEDSGGGSVAAPSGGHGLIGLRERVEILGGRFTAGPRAAGWRLSALLPAVAAAA
ncbi:MAG: hypothetical protein HOV79_11955 [Hamadaea sp.]|nr:hypothetical protein [Hamadaea sp.]